MAAGGAPSAHGLGFREAAVPRLVNWAVNDERTELGCLVDRRPFKFSLREKTGPSARCSGPLPGLA